MDQVFNSEIDAPYNTDRRADENEHEFRWRICTAKDEGLLDANWNEIAQILNSQIYDDESKWLHECVYRKEHRAAKEFYEQVFLRSLSEAPLDNVVLKTIAEEKAELQKLKQQIMDQKRELRKYERAEARAEHLHEIIREAASKMPKMIDMVQFNHAEVKTDCTEAVLFLTDWHYGMVTENVWNKYDTSVCEERVRQTVAKTIHHIRRHGVDTLHVVILGDMCAGAIHTSARVEAEEVVCEQLMNVSELLAQAIWMLTSAVHKVNVYSTYGNHMRTVQNIKDSIHHDNMERIIPWWLKERLSSRKEVKVIDEGIAEDIVHIPILGHNVIASHGDLDNIKRMGTTMHSVFSKRYGIDVEYVVMGHAHHTESLDALGVEAVIVPALCGSDGYAHGRRLYSEAGQMLMMFTKEEGLQCTYRITYDC